MSEALNRSLARGLDILALLSEHPRGLELHEIAKGLQLPKSSTLNLLRTLLEKRYVLYGGETAHYALSLKMLEIGSSAREATSVESVIRQYMQEISAACNETVHCGVPDGTDVIYVDKIESTRSIRMASRVGLRLPLYCTAMGRAILAAMPDGQVQTLLKDQAFTPITAHTMPSMAALLAELAVVRTQGYATEVEESNEKVCCIGVAVRGRDGTPQYAISISMPDFRYDDAQRQLCAQQLLRAQRKIERFLQVA